MTDDTYVYVTITDEEGNVIEDYRVKIQTRDKYEAADALRFEHERAMFEVDDQ